MSATFPRRILGVALAPPRRGTLLIVVGLTLIGLAILAAFISADPTPTTASTRRLFGLWRARHTVLVGALLVVAVGFLLAAIGRAALMPFLAGGLGTLGVYLLLELAGMTGLVSWPSLLAPRATELGALGTKRAPHLDVRGTTLQDLAASWGLRSEPVPFRYRTDRYGLRNEPDRQEADIYLIGDSILVAALVPFEQTVTARVERILRRPVMQVALIGLGPQEEHQLFRDTQLDVRGKSIIQFVFEGNDLLDSRRFRQPVSNAPDEWRKGGSLVNQIWRILATVTQPTLGISALRSCTISGQTFAFGWMRESFAGLEGESEFITDALQHFADEVRARGGEFAVAFVPTKLRVLGPSCSLPKVSDLTDLSVHLGPLRAHVLAWSKASGVKVLDLTEPLQAATGKGRIPWFWGDTHWNAAGHEAAAQALTDWEFLRRGTDLSGRHVRSEGGSPARPSRNPP
jgi:hypothetical protein